MDIWIMAIGVANILLVLVLGRMTLLQIRKSHYTRSPSINENTQPFLVVNPLSTRSEPECIETITGVADTQLLFSDVPSNASREWNLTYEVAEVDIPVAITQLKLNGIRSFSSLQLDLAHVDGSSPIGQWTLALGDNGVGKSTILQSLVLALVHPAVATALLQTEKSPAPLIRNGCEFGTIDLTVNDSLEYQVQISPGHSFERFIPVASPSERPPVFAYGPSRGSSIGGAARQVSFSAVGQVATLFDESAQLIHAETWLVQRKLAALHSPGGLEEAFFEAIARIMQKLLPSVDSIKVTADGVEISGPEIGKNMPLSGIGNGYMGTMGWVLDMVARWSYRYQQLTGEPPDGEFAQKMSGFVIVDEIGLHLHPYWQTTVVQNLRELFPNMSFIATSHHPLILLGARKGEIHVLQRHPETHIVSVEQADIPLGITTDQILTGRWFNLPSTLDGDTRQLLEEHRDLLRRGNHRKETENGGRITELENILRKRLGTFADTSIDRMALQVAAEMINNEASYFDRLTPEQKKKIRDEMMNELQLRTKNK